MASAGRRSPVTGWPGNATRWRRSFWDEAKRTPIRRPLVGASGELGVSMSQVCDWTIAERNGSELNDLGRNNINDFHLSMKPRMPLKSCVHCASLEHRFSAYTYCMEGKCSLCRNGAMRHECLTLLSTFYILNAALTPDRPVQITSFLTPLWSPAMKLGSDAHLPGSPPLPSPPRLCRHLRLRRIRSCSWSRSWSRSHAAPGRSRSVARARRAGQSLRIRELWLS